jgi:hypothetical protein
LGDESFILLRIGNYLTKFAYPKLACSSNDLDRLGAKPYQYLKTVTVRGETSYLQVINETACDDPRNLPHFQRGSALLSPRARKKLSAEEGDLVRLEVLSHLTLRVEPGRVDQSSGGSISIECPTGQPPDFAGQLMLIHPLTGARAQISAKFVKSQNSAIHLPKRLRDLLRVDLGAFLYATIAPVQSPEGKRTRTLYRRIFDFCVGQSAIHLRLCHAQPFDDGMGIARGAEEIFDVLGIERNDRVLLQGPNSGATCRLLPNARSFIEKDDRADTSQFELYLDASIRAHIEGQVGDVVVVERDTQYLISKRARDLLLPLIGTSFTVNQLFHMAGYRLVASAVFIPLVLVVSLAKERSLVKKVFPSSSFETEVPNDSA